MTALEERLKEFEEIAQGRAGLGGRYQFAQCFAMLKKAIEQRDYYVEHLDFHDPVHLPKNLNEALLKASEL